MKINVTEVLIDCISPHLRMLSMLVCHLIWSAFGSPSVRPPEWLCGSVRSSQGSTATTLSVLSTQ